MEVLRYPNPLLRKSCSPVEKFDDELRQLAKDMLEAMYKEHGVGLAAPQVGMSINLIIIDITADKSNPLVLVNPIIKEKYGTPSLYDEGCLSFPGIFQKMLSHTSIWVEYQDIESGNKRTLEAQDLLARAIQHECEHLQGILFIDRMSQKSRVKIQTMGMKGQIR